MAVHFPLEAMYEPGNVCADPCGLRRASGAHRYSKPMRTVARQVRMDAAPEHRLRTGALVFPTDAEVNAAVPECKRQIGYSATCPCGGGSPSSLITRLSIGIG